MLDNIKPKLFEYWATDVVSEWLPGYTDPEADPDGMGRQFKIVLQSEESDNVLVFRLENHPYPTEDKVFRVRITVEELS